MLAFPGHAGRSWPRLRWRSGARMGSLGPMTQLVLAFPGHAGRSRPRLRWRFGARMGSLGA